MNNLPDSPEISFAPEPAEPQPNQEGPVQQIPSPGSDIDNRAKAIEEAFHGETKDSEEEKKIEMPSGVVNSNEQFVPEQIPSTSEAPETDTSRTPQTEIPSRKDTLRQEAQTEGERIARNIAEEQKEINSDLASSEEGLKPKFAGQPELSFHPTQPQPNDLNSGLGDKAQIYIHQRQIERQREALKMKDKS